MTSDADGQGRWDPEAIPGLAPPPPAALSEQTVVVDGERFLVSELYRHGDRCSYGYDWLTGPNPGYGFGCSGPEQSLDDHLSAIRLFLSDIDPDTGYLSDPPP